MTYESYRLILKHEMLNYDKNYTDKDEVFEIEPPICISYLVDRASPTPTPIIINVMLEKLKDEILHRVSE